MVCYLLFLIVLYLVAVPRIACAEEDTFVQAGRWACTLPKGNFPPSVCPEVTFPKAFGGEPRAVMLPDMAGGRFADVRHITPNGFDMAIYNAVPVRSPRAPDAPASATFSGHWIAVGLVKPVTSSSHRLKTLEKNLKSISDLLDALTNRMNSLDRERQEKQ